MSIQNGISCFDMITDTTLTFAQLTAKCLAAGIAIIQMQPGDICKGDTTRTNFGIICETDYTPVSLITQDDKN